MLCGDLNGKEIPERGNICIPIADSLCCTVETNTTLYSNYNPIKIFFKRQPKKKKTKTKFTKIKNASNEKKLGRRSKSK